MAYGGGKVLPELSDTHRYAKSPPYGNRTRGWFEGLGWVLVVDVSADSASEFLSLRTTTVVVVVAVNPQRTTEPVEEVEVVDTLQLLNRIPVRTEDGGLVVGCVRLVSVDEFRFA